MGFAKSSSLFLLQAGVFVSGAAAICAPRPPCSPKDPLIALFNAETGAVPFCSGFLGLPVSTVVASTVTPTVVTPVTETSIATDEVTVVDGTSTLTVPASVVGKRDIAYPTWLPSPIAASRVASACSCLSVPLSVTTLTATGEATTATVSATVTETTTSTIHSTAIATETAQPVQPVISTRQVKIEVLRASNQQSIGWLYSSSGPAITSDSTRASTYTFTVTGGAQTASQVRITDDAVQPNALGFTVPGSIELENYYGAMISNPGTPPGSTPVVTGSSKYETDIWTVDTSTGKIGYIWINSQGTAIPDSAIALWRVGGRLYPVGNQVTFNAAFASVSTASKYQILLRFTVVSES